MTGLRVCLITILLTAIYLLASVGVSTLLFNKNSNGSLIKIKDKIIGSKLIGQNFSNSKYFHNRPSQNNYKNNISGNSNLPYYSKELKDFISIKSHDYLKSNETKPPDLNSISESASGLDPHITKENALIQAKRISRHTNIRENEIIDLITKESKPMIFGIVGERIVNVLELNIELEKLYAQKTRT